VLGGLIGPPCPGDYKQGGLARSLPHKKSTEVQTSDMYLWCLHNNGQIKAEICRRKSKEYTVLTTVVLVCTIQANTEEKHNWMTLPKHVHFVKQSQDKDVKHLSTMFYA
jgi:hypothetical protein